MNEQTIRLEKLNFIKNSLSKPVLDILQFAHIYERDNVTYIQCNDGNLAIDLEFNFPFEVTVKMDKFISAMTSCKKEPRFSITKTGRLSIISGTFRALLETTQATFPRMSPVDEKFYPCPAILNVVSKSLLPFISGTNQPWALSVMFKNGYGYATNNIILIRQPCPTIKNCNLSLNAVKFLASLSSSPLEIVYNKNYTVFKLKHGWVKCISNSYEWPDVSHLIKGTEIETDTISPILVEQIKQLKKFGVKNKLSIVTLSQEGVHLTGKEIEVHLDIGKFPESKFVLDSLLSVLPVATNIHFSNYPKPVYFKGACGIEGMLSGIL